MLTITPTTETITVTKLALTLTEQEARAILVDPTEFQSNLREALGDVAAARSNGRNKRGGKAITVSAKSAERVTAQRARVTRRAARPLGKVRAPKARKAVTTLSAHAAAECPHCQKQFTKRGMSKHIGACPQRPQATVPAA